MDVRDIVTLEVRVRIAIKLGESDFREFKSAMEGAPGSKRPRNITAIRRDIGEALVAFANADGGELLIGVEDDGEVTGIDCLSPQEIEFLKRAPREMVHGDTPLPSIRMKAPTVSGNRIFYFSVMKGDTYIHLTVDGRCLQRRGSTTVPMATERIEFERREQISRLYDREYVDGASVANLDHQLVRTAAEQISSGMSIEKYLQYRELAEYIGTGLRLRRAALLLFAKEPRRWYPGMQLRILTIRGTQSKNGAKFNAQSDETVSGTIFQLIERGWEALRPHLAQTRRDREGRFSTSHLYPEQACREALLNAIAHRDYSAEGRGIEIWLFDDRMEVVNPGALLSTLDIEDLRQLEGGHQSRNFFIARILREAGYVREFGEGIPRHVRGDACQRAGLSRIIDQFPFLHGDAPV